MKKKVKNVLCRVLLLSVIVFFSYTMINKATNMTAFVLNIAKTGIFPVDLIDIVAYSALLLELSCIVLLIYNEKRGIQSSLLMMVIFTLYIVVLYLKNRYEVCGCGGILNGLPFLPHLSINLFIIIVLIALLQKK
ncbi:MAG: hypothetical protein PUK16_08680 [Prevotellaceae bacterium]|nr:hypothetical protein [Prevotellaceae bacterium]